jgi:hypothetical protein
MPYVSMPPSTPHSRNPLLSQGPQSGPVSGVERLQAERELNTWSPAGANEPQRQLLGRTSLEGDRRYEFLGFRVFGFKGCYEI